MKPFGALLLAALVGPSLAVPAGQRQKCADQCDVANTFAYESGKSYVYEYSVATSTALLGTFNDDTQMHITATAHIDVSAPCEYILRLTDVNLVGSSSSQEFAGEISRFPLRFSFHDGRVENLCSEVSEPIWVLNFKRGVLSTFQNSMTHHGRQDIEETDISGVCVAHYNSTTEGNTIIVDKTKDLVSCSQRPDLRNFLPSTGYISDSPVQSLPLFKSTSRCQQKVEGGILTEAKCEESHVFRPFSSDEGGAVTTAKTTMTFVSQNRFSAISDFDFKHTKLPFEQTTKLNEEAQVESAEALLKDLEEASQSDIRPEVPSLFAKLVSSLRELSYPQLSTIYNNVKDTRAQKFLVDAMPLVETPAAFGVVRDMSINGDMTESETDVFFTSLAFVKNPTGDMFTAIAPLFEGTLSHQAMLGTSALINTYCKRHAECGDIPSVQRLIRRIEVELGSSCRSLKEAEKVNILVALKALGNAGRFVNANPILRRCYSEDNAMEVRVAAIEAFRHTPCDYDRSHLLAAFQDESQDTEVRIAAYLALMTCPTNDFITFVKDRLTSEGVNQVGSFIWTHMTNMQESAAPEKQWVREMIGEELLQKKFSTEALKFSRNYESSFFMNELNVGASVESNVIFSSKSYLPRSAMFNLTLDLFGQSINFFEVGGRIEGFEAYIERFFGPHGYYPEETIENILTTMRRNNDADATTMEGFLDERTDEPEGSYYVRVFGNELKYHHFRGIENLIQSSNPLEFLMELARKGNVDYTKSYQLMDAHHTIPTITGLPVTLNAKGTASLGLKMNGNFKARSLKNVNIQGHFHPSAAVLIDGVMLVDAHLTHTGIKMASSLHTSTLIEGKLQIKGGKLVDIAFNTPKDKMEVISVKTEFFYLEDGQEIQKVSQNMFQAEACTGSLTGLALCGDLSFTPRLADRPGFPLTGPVSADIYLMKTDTQTGYIFHFSKAQGQFRLEFDTPGSQTDHKVVVDVARSGNRVSFDIQTPFKAAVGAAEYVWQRNNKNVKGFLNIDGTGEYSFDTGLQTTTSKTITKIEPYFILTTPSREILNMQSTFAGNFGSSEVFLSSQVDAEYEFFQDSKQSLHHSGLLKKQTEGESQTYTLRFKVDPSVYPNMAVDIDAFSIISRQDYMDVTTSIDAKFADFSTSLTGVFQKTTDAKYRLQIESTINGESGVFEASLCDNSAPGKIKGNLDTSFKSSYQSVALHFDISADKDQAAALFTSKINGENYSLKLKGTRSSFLVDADIIKHIVVAAHVTSTDAAQKLLVSVEWDKDVDPTKAFIIDGLYSLDEIHAIIKYGEKEASAVAKLISNGVEMEAKWATDQRIYANVHYTLGSTTSLATTVQTPFQGWEKQDATITISIKDYEVNGGFAITWKNTQQIALTVSSKLEPGFYNNALTTKVSFASPFDEFERIIFSLNHKMTDSTINTDLESTWNQSKMESHFQLSSSVNGLDARATFTSPFTEDVLGILHHELLEKELLTVLEVKYGQDISTANIKGQISLEDTHAVTLVFKADTTVTSVPEIDASVKYTLSGDRLNLVTEGKIGAQKIMLNANGYMVVSEDSTDISGDLRFIAPFTYPLTASLKHAHDHQHFTSQFEMTRIWSTYGNIKAHAEGRMMSQNDIALDFYLSSPETKASASLKHKITDDNVLTSAISVAVNEEFLTLNAKGHLDAMQQYVDIRTEMTSSLRKLQDIKVHVETKRNENNQVTKIVMSKNTQSITVDHLMTFEDWLNWESSLDINGIYKLVNKQTHAGSVYTHSIDYFGMNQLLQFSGTLDKQISGSSRKVEFHSILSTPWTEDMKLDFYHQDDGTEYKPTLIVEYKPGMKIELATILKLESTIFNMESSLTTPFWDPLGLVLNIAFEPKLAATFGLSKGPNKTTIDVSGTWEEGKLAGLIRVDSTYLTNPISVEVLYDIISSEKIVHLIFSFEEKYEVKGTFSGHLKEAKWYLTTQFPFENIKHITFSGEYSVETMPLSANVVLILNSDTYQVSGKIGNDEFIFNVDLNGKNGKLIGNWEYEENYAYIQVTFNSPFPHLEDMGLSGTYDFRNEKRTTFEFTYGSQKINVNAWVEGKTLFIEGTTPFSGWEKLDASFFFSKSAVNAFVSSNDRKIEVTGTLHLKKAKGKVNLVVNTPFIGYETITIDTSYILQGQVKKVEFESTFNSNKVSIKSEINISNQMAPEMSLSIITPFETIGTVGGEVRWNIRDFIKTAEVKAFHNDHQYLWQLAIAAETSQKGYAKFQVTTPIAGWTTMSVEGKFDFSSMPHKVTFMYEREGVVKTFEGQITFDHNSITVEVTTPVSDWEKLILNGNFGLDNNHFKGNFELSKGTETFSMVTDIVFSNLNPKVHIEVTSPITYAANIEFSIDANFTNTEKKLHTLFKRNDITYSLDLLSEHTYQTGYFKIIGSSPIHGYTSVDVYAKYDFTGDVKIIETTFNIEGNNKHFSLSMQVNDNHITASFRTPFNGFETVKISGNYIHDNNEYSGFVTFENSAQKYDFQVEIDPVKHKILVNLTTPIAELQNIAVLGKYDILDHGIEGSVTFKRNLETFAFKTRLDLSLAKSDLHLALDTPIEGWRKMVLNMNYDIISEKKSARIFIQKDSFEKKFSVEGSCSLSNGLIKIETPIAGYESQSVKYKLGISADEKTLTTVIVFSQNSNQWPFKAYGHYDTNKISLKLETPFENFDIISLEGSIDLDHQNGKGIIRLGSYKIMSAFSFADNDISFELTTPFNIIKIISLSAKYTWSTRLKNIVLNIIYNDSTYGLNSTLHFSTRKSEVSFEANTPFIGFQNLSTKFEYDIDNKEELALIYVSANDREYKFKIGGYIEENKAFFTYELRSPFSGFEDDKFVAKIDLTNEDKTLEIILVRQGQVKAITINGNFIGNTFDFGVRTQIKGSDNNESANRAKRSLDFTYMQDEAEVSLATSFNSVKFHLKTPFENFEEITWEISKVNENTVKAEWKRNANYITILAKRDEGGEAFKVDLDGEMHDWLLWLLGSDQTGEDMIKLSGHATLDVKGVASLKIETPFENYKTIEANFDYKFDQRSAKLEISSSSSSFHFLINVDSKIEGQLKLPDSQQDIDIAFSFEVYKGKVTIQSLTNVYFDYNLNVDGSLKFDHTFKLDDKEISKADLSLDIANSKAHIDATIHFGEYQSSVNFDWDAYNSLHFIFKREVTKNEETTEKHISLKIVGSGNLPDDGTLDITLENSFLEPEGKTTVHVELNHSEDRRKIKAEVTIQPSNVYVFSVDYLADLEAADHGDFNIEITTPEETENHWQHLSGNWNLQNHDDVKVTFKLGDVTYTATGKLSLQESNLVLTSSDAAEENIFLQWHFKFEGSEGDYFVKLGKETNYALIKLKGTFLAFDHVELEGAFRAGILMDNELAFTSKWQNDAEKITSEGTFTYGEKSGEYHIDDIHYDSSTKSASYTGKFTSNIIGLETISITGKCDFNSKFVIQGDITVNDKISKIDINIAELYPETSHNTIEFHLPIFGESMHIQFTLSHDFSNELSKSLTAIAKFGDNESSAKVHWKQSENFDTFEGSLEVKCFILGEIHISSSFDLTNAEDMHADIKYSRTLEGEEKNVGAKWVWKSTTDHFETNLNVDSSFSILHHAQAYVKVDYTENVHLDSGIEWNEEKITFVSDITKEGLSITVTSPFEYFTLIEAKLTYSLADNPKKVNLNYKRGDNEVNMEFTVDITSDTEAKLDFTLNTPFDVIKTIHVSASIEGQKAHVEFQRNDDKYSLDGDVEFKVDKSSVDMTFTAPEEKVIKVAASYDVEDFLAGTGTEVHKLASLELQFEESSVKFNFNGYRNEDKLYIDIQGESSFEQVKNLHLKIDTILNTESHDSNMEIQFNDFKFAMTNHFEKQDDVHYKVKSKFESTITPLPALIFGFGREDTEYSVTVGYGEDKEITFSVKGKDNYESGFSGKIDIPVLGYNGIEYEVEYGFENDNELELDFEVDLGEDKEVEAKFTYNSEGIKASFNSLRTGEHALRVRRSAFAQGFSTEAGNEVPRSMNRAKRSLDFTYMQDEAEVSLVTSFNSVKFHLKTPFENFEEITWEISKVNENTLKAEWKRNANYITILAKRDEGGEAFKVDLDGEMHDWLLWLLGSDQTGEDMIKLSGHATLDVKGVASLKIETPFENYKTIEANFDYKFDQRSAKLEISSSSSSFHFLINVDSKIEGQLKLPDSQQDIDIAFSFEVYKGKVTIQSLTNVYFDYNLNVDGSLKFDHTFKLDDKEISKADLSLDIANSKAHIDATIHFGEYQSSVNFDWDAYNSLNFIFKREVTENEETTEKHISLKIVGSGNLPDDGTLDITLENSFLEPEGKTTVHVELNHSEDRRKIKAEVTIQPSNVYVFSVDYLADLEAADHGDFNIEITTPEETENHWQHLSGNWNLQNHDDVKVTFKLGDVTYTATGKLSLQESNLVLTSSDAAEENIFLQWHFKFEGSDGDYFVKLGKETNYALIKLKGTFLAFDHVELEGAFRAGILMDSELAFTSKWQNDDEKFTSEGTFTYGEKSGEYHIDDIHYDSSTKSASYTGKFTSNIIGLETISITGKCDFNSKFVIQGDITVNDKISKIDINIAELYPETSHNTIEFHLPIFGESMHIQFTLSHDFSNELSKSLTAIAKFGDSESSAKVHWEQSENFDTFEGSLEVKCFILGEIHVSSSFDLTNAEDMHADIKYSRTLEGEEKNVGAKWVWKSTTDHFETNLNVDSSFSILHHAQAYVKVDYTENVHLDSGIEWNEEKITFVSDITKEGLSITVTSPFEYFTLIEAKLTYSLADNPKKVNLNYKRGDNEVNMEFTVDITSDTEAKLDFTLNTPFDVIKTIHVSASIEGQKAHVEFQRNDDKYSLDGDVEFKVDKSSVDMTFTAPEEKVIKVAASYDVEDFLAGTGTEVHKLASLELQFEESSVKFNFNGYRNEDKLYIDIQGESSFEQVKNLHLKIDTILNTESHDSNMEIQFNDFKFAMTNHFEKQDDVHYKVKSKFESTITPLPALIFGFGREDTEYSVTVGYGEDKEITFSVKGKDNYESGFSGKIDIPVLGYNGIEYEVEYGFENDNELELDFEVDLGEDKEVEAKFTYNSEGIKASFNSLRTGEHALRVRRSSFAQGFSTEAGNEVPRSMNRAKRSLDFTYMQDEAEVSLATSFNSVKFHLKTPFENFEEITWEISNVNENTLKAEWKRNANYITILAKRDEGGEAFKVDLDGEMHDWLLWLLGSDQTGEDMIKLSGHATLDVKGVASLKIETPFENYKTIEANFDYKFDQRSAKLEISSSSSSFHFLINVDSKIEGQLKLPHSQQDIDIAFSFEVYKGKVTIQSLTNVYFDYNLNADGSLKFDHTFKLDDKEISKADLSLDIANSKAHIDATIHFGEYQSSVSFDWDAYNSLNFIFKREVTENEETTEKHISLKIVGSGNLPDDGTLDITLENSFLEPEGKTTVHVELNHSEDRRKIKAEVTIQPSNVYVFSVDYLADLEAADHGDFNIEITTPEETENHWQHLSGNWNLQNHDDVKVTFKLGDVTYTATGKLSLQESNLVLTSSDAAEENIFLQWHFKFEGSDGDYFVKLGKETNYALIKLKGTFLAFDHVELEGAFRAGILMDSELAFTSKWQNDDEKFTSEGTFTYGEKSGEYHIDDIHYDSSTKSASYTGKFTSNIIGLETISITGKCDFNSKFVIQGDITVNDKISKIDINIAELYPETSHNTIEFHLPIFGESMHIQFTLSHDFSNELSKSLTAIAKFGDSESSAKVHWEQSENFDTFEGSLEVKCFILGEIHVSSSFDLTNAEDMHADIKYSRTLEGEEKNVGAKWVWKSTTDHFETNLNVDSSFSILHHAQAYVKVDYTENVHLDSGIEWNDEKITFVSDITKEGLSITVTSPFEYFTLIEAKLTYSLADNPKKVNLNYKRGDNEVNMEFTVDITSDTEAKLDFTLNTPFDVIKTIHVSASIEGQKAHVEFQRNDDKYSLDGDVEFKVDKSSVDMTFTAPEEKVIKVAASYDVEDFLAGTGTEVHKLASLELQFEESSVKFNFNGYRNEDKLYIDIQGESSFEQVKNLHLKIDTILNTESHDSNMEIQFNDFKFAMTNHFEKQDDVHYKVKSKFESTITPLPALIFGFGREDTEYSVTVGYGEDKEITFSVKGKDNYEAGFSGKIDIPVLGYNGIEYEVEYGFENDNELELDFEVDLGEDKEVEAKFTYNSEGIKASFNSFRTGEHAVRVRRSVSAQGFSAEAAYNDYALELHGGLNSEANAHGALIEGDIFGHRFLFDSLFQSDDVQSEVRLILVTPFHTADKIGGRFTWSNNNNKIEGEAEIYTPFNSLKKITGEINLDMNRKISGQLIVNISGKEFILKTNLVGTTVEQGYEGSVEIYTPFHSFSKVGLSGHFKISGFQSFESDFKITRSLDGKIQVSIGQEIHHLSGKMLISNNNLMTKIDVESGIFGGKRAFLLDFTFPDPLFRQISMDAALTVSETHALHFDLDVISGLQTTVEVNSPLLPKSAVSLKLTSNAAELSVSSPSGAHNAKVKWRFDTNDPADWLLNFDLSSPLLTDTLSANISINGYWSNTTIKAELQFGAIRHSFEGRILITNREGTLLFTIETPYNNIRKVNFEISLNFAESITLHVMASHANEFNTFDVTLDREGRSITTVANSPFIPGREASIEARLSGDISKNMMIKIKMMAGGHVISGDLLVRVISLQYIEADLDVLTPFEGYQKLTFRALYTEDNMKHILIYTNHPLDYRVELHFGDAGDVVKGELYLLSPFGNFENIKANLEIPLNAFAPRVSTYVTVGDVLYGGDLGLRLKAPYEVTLGYNIPDISPRKFHLRTDSSFFSFFA